MKTIEVTDEQYARLMALAERLEWSVEKTMTQILDDAEDLQATIEDGQARELARLVG